MFDYKTQYLYIGEETTDLQLKNNERIERCENYTYLWIHFYKEETDLNDITHRINKTTRLIKPLNEILLRKEIKSLDKKHIGVWTGNRELKYIQKKKCSCGLKASY